jgi:glycosyltransferase involved in cell wall biosynthesis
LKLLFIQDALINAGAERSHLQLLSRFAHISPTMVYLYPKHELKTAYQEAGIRLIFLDIPEAYNFHLAIPRLVKLIKKEKPDLLVSCLWRADMVSRIASKLTGVPLIGTLVNDSYAPLAWKDKKGLKYKLVYWLDSMTAGIPIHWIANAQALADSHVKTLGINKEKISVVYRGRPVQEQSKAQKTTATVKHFISYGRLLERKGFQDAIEAFAQVLHSYPDCSLTIFGEGPFRKQLEIQIQRLGISNSVFLPGKIDNPMEVLIHGYSPPFTPHSSLSTPQSPLTTVHSSLFTNHYTPSTPHCFLFPSWYEGFSGALVEAMMAGMPIIASDIGMNLEAVTDQDTALIFPVQDVQALAKAMLFAVENPETMQDLGAKARTLSQSKFNIEQIAQQYEQTLIQVFQAWETGKS